MLNRGAWTCLLLGAFGLPFIALFPSFSEIYPGIYLWDQQRVAQAILVIAGLGLKIKWLISRGNNYAAPWKLLLSWGLVGLLSLISSLNAHYPAAALLDAAWMHALVALVLLAAMLFRTSPKAYDYLLACAGLASLIYVFWFFIRNSDHLFSYDFQGVQIVFPGFGNSRYFSDLLAVLVFLAPLSVNRFVTESRARVLSWGLVGLLFMLAFVAGSRGMLAGQVVAHLGLLVFYRKSYLKLFRTYLFCWGFGAVLFVILLKIYAPWSLSMGAPQTKLAELSSLPASVATLAMPRLDSSGRGELVEKSVRLFTKQPILGHGGRHFGCFLKEDFFDPHNRFNGDSAHPHNSLLQLATEWGIVVMLLALFGILMLLKTVTGRFVPERNISGDCGLALLGATLALLVHSMMNGVINAPVSQMLLVLLLGWGVSFCLDNKHGYGDRFRYGLSVLLFLIMAVISVLLVTELSRLPESNQYYRNEGMLTWYLAPRFWQQGWLLPLCGKI